MALPESEGGDEVLRIGITGASGRLGSLLASHLGAASAQLGPAAAVTIIVPFVFDVADYQPWAGTAGAGDALFADAVDTGDELAAARAAGDRRAVRKPRLLDLGDPAAVTGAFAGLDIVVHLAATIHADAAW